MTCAELFVKLRYELALTQVEYAKLLGLAQGTVSKIEAGKQDPALDAFRRFFKVVLYLGSAQLFEEVNRFLWSM